MGEPVLRGFADGSARGGTTGYNLPVDSWDDVRALFHQALDVSADQWPDLLSAIPDAETRSQVERLLSTAAGLDSEFLEAPSVFKGRYQVERLLGKGGQATVWLARDLQCANQLVAIKVLNLVEEHAAWLRKRFVGEWTVLSQLRHENIVTVLDFGEMDGLPFLVMEYAEGETLRQRMAAPMPPSAIAAITRQLGTALGAAHRAGICHRDLKPENVIVTGENRVKLIDFGIAQVERLESGGTVTVLMLAGTARYMAAEQFLGICSACSDVYSFAVVIYELLAGHCPYMADEAIGIARAQRHRSIRTVLRESPEVPKRLAPLLAAALSLDPEQRPEKVEAFAQEAAAIILEPTLSWKRGARNTLNWLRSSLVPRLALGAMLVAAIGWQAVLRWQESRIETVYETVGAADPEDAGFRPHNDVSGTVLYNEAGDGLEAWEIATGSQGHYYRPLSDAQKRVALANGWSLTIVAKPLEGNTYADVDFFGRSPEFVMEFAAVKGKLLAQACNRLIPKYDFMEAVTEAAPDSYHEFRMTYDPRSKTAKIAVDGKTVITGYRGMRQFQGDLGVDFGAERYRSPRGKGAFKLVRFEIFRERPSSS